jgi:hypothetical protein
VQQAGGIPADPYNYSGSMGDCPAHTGYTGAVFGVPQSAVCDENCAIANATCVVITP